MTDNEIIKAWEHCFEGQDCRCCAYYHTSDCSHQVRLDVAAIIDRQKAEIERLTAKIAAKDNINDYNTAQLRIARENLAKLKQENSLLSRDADTAFQDGLNEAQDLYAEQVRQEVKSEAIKEFAKRLKEKFGVADCIVTVDNNDIDNLVKEMTEVKENE